MEQRGVRKGLSPEDLGFGRLYDSVPDGVVVTTTDHVVVLWNRAAARVFGRPAEAMSGSVFTEILTDADRAIYVDTARTVLDEAAGPELREARRLDLEIERPDLPPASVEVTLSAIEDRPEVGRFLLLLARDVSAVRRAEAARRRLASIVATAGDAIVSLDAEGRVTSWNAAAERMFGYSEHDVLGREATLLAPPGWDPAVGRGIAERLAQRGGSISLEGEASARDGRRVFLSYTVWPLLEPGGAAAGYAMILRDATRRRKAEEALRESEARFRLTFDHAPIGMALVSPEGRIVRVNERFGSIVGHPARELVRMRLSELVDPRDRKATAARTRELEKAPGMPVVRGRSRMVRGDGAVIHVDLSLAALRAPDGSPTDFIVEMEDVTEGVRLSDELRSERDKLVETNSSLVRANEALEAFTHVVSHDLKEPLRAIGAYLDALLEDHAAHLDEEALRLARAARQAEDRLAVLVNELLELSRISRKGLPRDEVDLGSLLESPLCRARFEDLADKTGAAVEFSGDLPRVLGFPSAICQAVGNAIVNSVKHNDPGVRVTIRAEEPARARSAAIVVEDDGRGFSEDLVERFKAGDVPAATGGGFGLMLARRAMERMGGNMWLGPSTTGGAAVHFEFEAPNA